MSFFQFSLRRLLAGVTVVCVLCALAVAFPAQALAVGLLLAVIGPGLIVAAGVAAASSQRFRAFFLTMAGAFMGGTLAPMRTGPFQSSLDEYLVRLYYAAPCVLGGALLAGGLVLFIEFINRPRRAMWDRPHR
jgi:hypothetical protein